MKKYALLLAAAAALALSAAAAEPLRLGPAQANAHKFADWPEETSAGTIDHAGGALVFEYSISAAGAWNGRAQVNLRDADGRAVAGLRSRYRADIGKLETESVVGGRIERLAAPSGRCEIELPAGRYLLTGCRATCPKLVEDDVVGSPVAHAINLEVAVR